MRTISSNEDIPFSDTEGDMPTFWKKIPSLRAPAVFVVAIVGADIFVYFDNSFMTYFNSYTVKNIIIVKRTKMKNLNKRM